MESLLTWHRVLRGKKRKEATRLINYVVDRRDMINYPEFVERGWQIGSGPTESRCKTSTSRLKGRGRRWDMPNAEAVAALTTLKDSPIIATLGTDSINLGRLRLSAASTSEAELRGLRESIRDKRLSGQEALAAVYRAIDKPRQLSKLTPSAIIERK
ncbi:MAG: hypothetical protein ACI93T_001680 [Porticoccaceae bacterium]